MSEEQDRDRLPGAEAGIRRRDFLTGCGTAACALATLGSGLVTLDYLNPKVLFEPPSTFRAGLAGDYPDGTVRFNKDQRTYVIGGLGGVYALQAVCTHLGCVTRYLSDENIIACPCHGSRFDLEGTVIQGPAPRPLPWLDVQMDATDNVFVDTGVIVPRGKVLKV